MSAENWIVSVVLCGAATLLFLRTVACEIDQTHQTLTAVEQKEKRKEERRRQLESPVSKDRGDEVVVLERA